MKRILLSILFFLPFLVSAQNLIVNWANAIGGAAGNEVIQSTVVDASGFVYIGGSFEGTVNFNPNGTASNLTSLGLSDAFFAKYTSAGLLVWANRLGSTGSDEVYAITVDGSGNVYVAGYFNATVDFDPSATTSNLTASGSDDIFYGKYSSVGALTWANAHGSADFDAAVAIKVDPSGNVYVTGYFTGTVDFDPSNVATNIKTAVGTQDIFLGKFSSAGALMWIDTFGSATYDAGVSIDLDNSNVYISGSYSGTIDLDPGASNSATGNLGGDDVFFAKYALSTGALVWWATIRSSVNDQATSIVVSGTNFYLGGVFSGSASFYSMSGNVTKVSNGGSDIFIAKYDGATSLPTLTWLNTIGGSLDDRSNLLAIDASANVYSTGFFQGTVDFDPSAAAFNLVSTGLQDIYLASYDATTGAVSLAKKIGGTSDDEGTTIAIDASNNVYTGGYFQGTASFDFSSTLQNKTSLGLWDGYIAKYSPRADEPTAQPTNLVFTSITSTSYAFSFTAAVAGTTAPDGYIGIRKIGSAPTGEPADGVTYAFPDVIGDGTVNFSGAGTTYTQSGALPSTTYNFTIFSYKGSGTSINYKQVSPLSGSVTTLSGTDTTEPFLNTNTTPTSVNKASPINVTVTLRDAESGIAVATIYYASLEDAKSDYSNFVSGTMVKGTGEDYTFQIPGSFVKEMGVTYYFYLENGVALTYYSSDYSVAVKLTTDGLTIPFTGFGTDQTKYRIVSIPVLPTTATAEAVFGDDLGAYDKKSWRLFRYQGSTTELNGKSTLQVGNGYWLIASKSVTLDTGPGTTPAVNIFDPFKLVLTPGWNQIGNPYPYDVKWSAILEWNGPPAGITKLRTFNGNWGDGTELEKFSGGFVMNAGSSSVTLEVPTFKDPSINGRQGTPKMEVKNPIDNPDWNLTLNLEQGGMTNSFGGLGMNHAAAEGYDVFDDFNLPRFTEFIEVNHINKELHRFSYSKDVVPFEEQHTWEFSVESNSNESVTMKWDNSFFGENSKHLVLWDVTQQRGFDMRLTNQYVFNKSRSGNFKVFYGDEKYIKEKTAVEQLVFHEVFPNPAKDMVTISFSVPGEERVTIDVIDLLGRKIATVADGNFKPGYHEVSWNTQDDSGNGVTNGIYITQIKSLYSDQQKRLSINK